MQRDWHLDEDRAWALGMEVRTAILHMEEGLRQFARLNDRNDFFPASTVLLGTGYEHFMKLDLALLIEFRTGSFPTTAQLRAMGGPGGHSLMRLFDEIVAEARTGAFVEAIDDRKLVEQIADHSVLRQTVQTLSDLAAAERRYFFLDLVVGESYADKDPVQAMTQLDRAVNRATRDPNQPGHRGALADMIVVGDLRGALRVRKVVVLEALEMFAHLLAKLYVFASPLPEAMLKPWLDLEWFGVPPKSRWSRRRTSGSAGSVESGRK